MVNYRWVKTSRSDFLEAREGSRVIMRLTRNIKIGDIGVLFMANDVVHVYALERGDLIPPEDYASAADRARALVEHAAKGKLCLMGQLWMSKHNNTVSIANVILGSVTEGRFKFSNSDLMRVGCSVSKAAECGRTLNRITRLEIEQREVCA